MTLTVVQQYPINPDEEGAKSMRFNHPDWGDVYRTTIAKGVITDFEKVADDPIEVKSRVKVEIDGYGESEYLPLFFHPKALYWDDPGTPPSPSAATDFNEEGKYFEKAWMSFRGGDEVVVMLQEGVPVAVLGFADGVPRIGENTFLFKAPGRDGPGDGKSIVWNFTQRETHYEGDFTEDEFYGPDDVKIHYKEVKPFHECEWVIPDPCGWGNILGLREFIICVGPFLCVLQLSYYIHDPDDRWDWAENVVLYYGINKPELEEQVIAHAKSNHSCTKFWDYFCDALSEITEIFDYPDLLIIDNDFWENKSWPLFYKDKSGLTLHYLQFGEAQVFTQVHTKEELIEANMWPHEV